MKNWRFKTNLKLVPGIFIVAILGFLLGACTEVDGQPSPPLVPSPDPALSITPPATDSPLISVELTHTSSTNEIRFPFDCIPTDTSVETGVVTYIVDGDSIFVEVDGQEKEVRYIGMDTPEMNPPEPGAAAAAQRNAELVEGKTVTMVRDVSEVDPYDRLLRYVLVGDVFVNYELVSGGFAEPKRYWPDVACNETLQNAQVTISSSPSVVMPTVSATTFPTPAAELQPTQPLISGCPNGCTSEQDGCSIKGNISLEGEKIYHLPGMSFYDKTKISPEYGERWFCTEDEASANGWRKAMR